MRTVLWNKETDKEVVVGDKVQSFRDEPWIIEWWNGQTGKVYAKAVNDPKPMQREFYHRVFPALEWREE